MGGRAPGSRMESSFRARSVVGMSYKQSLLSSSDAQVLDDEQAGSYRFVCRISADKRTLVVIHWPTPGLAKNQFV
jgi:hypothetical protein